MQITAQGDQLLIRAENNREAFICRDLKKHDIEHNQFVASCRILPILTRAYGATGIGFSSVDAFLKRISWLESLLTDPPQDILDRLEELFSPEKYPFDYQKGGIAFGYHSGSCGPFDSPGLGKTIQSIGIARLLQQDYPDKPVIVICTATVMRQWRSEIRSSAPDGHPDKFEENILLIDGPKKKRMGLYDHPARWLIINYEKLFTDLDIFIKWIKEYDPIAVFLDEATEIKNLAAKRTDILHKIFNNVDHRYPITATPVQKDVVEGRNILDWAQPGCLGPVDMFKAYFCERERRYDFSWVSDEDNKDGSKRAGRIFIVEPSNSDMKFVRGWISKDFNETLKGWGFRWNQEEKQWEGHQEIDELKKCIFNYIYRNCVGKPRMNIYYKTTAFKNVKTAEGMCRGLYFRRTPNDVGIEMPEIIPQTRYIKQNKAIKDAIKKATDNVNLNALERYQAISMACLSPSLYGISSDGPKVKELKKMLNGEYSDQKVIVFCRSRKFTMRMLEIFKDKNPLTIHGGIKGDDRELSRQKFINGGPGTVIFCTSAAEEGVDMPGANAVIHMDVPHHSASWRQRVGRAVRAISKEECVLAINLIVEETVEEKMFKTMQDRGLLAEEFLGDSHLDMAGQEINDNDMERMFE